MRLFLLALGALLFSCGPKENVKGFQVRVVWLEQPSTEATIVWTQNDGDETAIPTLSLQADLLQAIEPHAVVSLAQYENPNLFETKQNPYTARAIFKNLMPNTKYYLQVATSNSESPIYQFQTAPDHDDYGLLFGGDSRSNHDNRRFINRSIRDILANQPEIIAFVHGGDYIADGNDWRQWQLWLNDYALTTLEDGRLLPIIPTRGNHETNKTLYNQVFGLDPEHPGYFKTSIGSLDLITLNSEESVMGLQYQWLEQELMQSQSAGQWTFTNYHRPAYPAVKRASETKKWVPLFEDYGVRLAFESDGHTFKKTLPIFNDEADEQRGIIYVGEGGLGVKQRSPKHDRWYLKDGGVAFKKHHFLQMTHQGRSFKIQALDETGQSFHEFIIDERR
ncbi:purple acid phosphatase family protein [Pseudobacteriovorax antillogorgiicola]|uniref:Purple acid Phosphatase, N-terminal domain n=1 Tax=Pseudobacteriovorax antillogorgiicola TaxID=1513793 RepID=A0A1Y6BBR7_9BACT|nr:metallophosphoesterase family protein [Pseudobacteriovorax antillogorgiicola]TCS58625.1 calcineurin-like phosphoesterase family protein [Pseudobacteriovorax antillogorgiicola]SME96673.1 Purple acid Phosphatase, N-terminal domain [Pseudobacteriovorax antillogorgiicola]